MGSHCRNSTRAWRHTEAHREIDVPNLDFTGWYDHCGNADHFAGMRKNARTGEARRQTKIIIGPWNHCNLGARKQAGFDFGPDAEIDVCREQIRWFDYHLKGVDNGMAREPAVRYFVMGSGTWRSTETWPPQNLDRVEFHLASRGDAQTPDGSGALVRETQEDSPPDRYSYDPAEPIPSLWDSAYFYNVADRRCLDSRKDILRYRTAPLEEEIEVAGYPEVVLYAASSAPDTDFFARLVDEAPGGPAMEVCYGMLRARHRNTLESEELLAPGEVTRFQIRMGMTACRFRKDHRIRLEICSSDFPNHDRNHNLGRNDLLDAELAVAQQTIHHSPEYPSALILTATRTSLA